MRILTIIFLWTMCFLPMQLVFGQSNGSGPLLHLDMELGTGNQKTGFSIQKVSSDSIVAGIHGNALYFDQASNKSAHIRIGNRGAFSNVWSNNFSVVIWMATKAQNSEYQVIGSNKEWNNGEIKDYTTNHEFGFSRTSGSKKGWAIICQPDGSWAWNIGDGKHRFDYRPTAPRQQVNDGAWHQIAFSVSRDTDEARLYFDGTNVAIYNIKELGDLDSDATISLASDILAEVGAPAFQGALDEFRIYDRVIDPQEVAAEYSRLVPAARLPELSEKPVTELNLMAWNIWHGGRKHGREIGPKQAISFIKDTGTDIVMMQETYGSGPLIADALGYYFYLASNNISVMSKYPILDTSAPYDAFRLGVTSIQLSKKQKINLASLWIHYLPDWRSDVRAKNVTAEKIVEGEGPTRHKEIKEILAILKSKIDDADKTPLIVGGDFNSPSLLDWGNDKKDWHNNLSVEWPVSKEMLDSGFKDSFREIRPNLDYASPTMTAEKISWRIDYIYYKGKALKAMDSDMYFKYKGVWPSDHPAVTTKLTLDVTESK